MVEIIILCLWLFFLAFDIFIIVIHQLEDTDEFYFGKLKHLEEINKIVIIVAVLGFLPLVWLIWLKISQLIIKKGDRYID